jgi:hypothetical protein
MSDPTATAPTIDDTLVEPARRRDDWREGESLVLLDGARWQLRRPADAGPEFAAELSAYRAIIASIDADAAAGTIDADRAIRHVVAIHAGLYRLGSLLLRANYHLADDEVRTLLPFGDTEAEFLATTVRVGRGDPTPLNVINAIAELIGPALRSTPSD